MTEAIQIQNIAIHGVIFLEGDEERILNLFSEAKDIEIPESLDSQIVNIPENNPEGSALVFSDGLPQDPIVSQGSVEIIALSVDDDGDISFTIDLSPDSIDSAVSVFENITKYESAHVTDFDLEYELEPQFSELDISITGPDDLSFDGLRFSDGEFNYIAQVPGFDTWNGDSSPTVEKDQDEEASQNEAAEQFTVATVMSMGHFDIEDSGDFIYQRIDAVEETLEKIVP